eukprot:3783195-Amphidinium_carterae.1
MDAFTQSASQQAHSTTSGSHEQVAMHVSIATPREQASDSGDLPTTAMDTDSGPTLEDTLTDDACPSPAGAVEAPPTDEATREDSDQPRPECAPPVTMMRLPFPSLSCLRQFKLPALQGGKSLCVAITSPLAGPT